MSELPSQAQYASSMIAALAVSEPDLDTTTGSVARKLIDAWAAQLAGASIDSHLLTYQYDINSKVGADLDAFVQVIGGLSRFPAARATGTVTFTRGTSSDVISIPVNAQVATADGSVVFQTVSAAILGIGDLTATVPAQAVTAGPQGNLAAGTLTAIQVPVAEVSSASNLSPTSGGANQETDSQLQARWKATAFRSMAGTEQMLTGVALNNPDCTAANVVGSSTRRREQVQIVGGSAFSTVNDAQFIYPSGQVVGRDIDNGDVAAPGIQYIWNFAVNPPQIQVIDAGYFPDGEVVDLSFIYLDDSSRNDPGAGIFNRTDLWVAGTDPVNAVQSLEFSPAISFSVTPSDQYYTGGFTRPDGTSPAAGNYFIPLAFGPIITVPATVTVNNAIYGLATAQNPMGSSSGGIRYAYQIVHQTGAYGWSAYSQFGLEWKNSMAPAAGNSIVLGSGYVYNQLPALIQRDIDNWKLAGTDVRVHQALTLFLQFSLAVIYAPGATVSVVQAAIGTAIAGYLSSLGFNSRIYPGSVIKVVEETPGVVAARFIVGSDVPRYSSSNPNASDVGIQEVVQGTVVRSYVDSAGNPLDVEIGDDTIPSYGGAVLITRAPNSFGAFA